METYKIGKDILIVADFRNINYEDENNVPEVILAKKLDIDLYPIMCNPLKVIDFLRDNYSDCGNWFTSKSIYEYFN
jgi:hypothetical protein